MMTNPDDYRIASPFLHKHRVWLLLTIASLLVGMGLGWILPQVLGSTKEFQLWFLSLFAAAFILVVAAISLQSAATSQRRKQRETLRRGIDLAETQKSLINFGYQPPIVDAPGFRTQLLKISRRTEIPNLAPLMIVEHFAGTGGLVRCESIHKDYSLSEKQLVRIDFSENDRNRHVTIIPVEESSQSTCYVLVHFIMNE